MAAAPLDPDDPRVVGPYALRARLGEGGMGVVYLADGREGPVAIKVVRRALASEPSFRSRFRREVEAARRVRGRGVVQLLDADTEGPRPYLVMAFVDGPTLTEAVAADGPVRGEPLQALAVALAEAVTTIHRAGVTHRDLKPTNVLLAADQPVVVDFGVATASEATSITVAGTVMGSPGWMAPEQVRGEPPSPAMDVFTWGTLVAWAATGRNPFGEGRPEAVAYRIIHEEPELSGVPAELRVVVSAALAKDPARRPTAPALLARLLHQTAAASPAALAADATELIARTWARTPELAPPPPPPPPPAAPPRPRRWARRVAAVLTVVVVGGLLGLGAGLGIRTYRDRGGDQAGADTVPPPATTTSTTVPNHDLVVRWVIQDNQTRTVGEGCAGEAPYDEAASLTLTDVDGQVIEQLPVANGVAEPGTSFTDIFGGPPGPGETGNTYCAYSVRFTAVPVIEGYRLTRDPDGDVTELTPDELVAAGWQVELTTDLTSLFD